MRYPYYKFPERFQPNVQTLKLWLNTRKSEKGLFETDKFSLDRNWFIIAILIEIAAFSLTIWGGYLKYIGTGSSKVLILAIVASILFVLLDYFGVLIHHQGKDTQVKAASRLKFEKDIVMISSLQKQARPGITTNVFFGFLCMLLSAILKITSLLLLISFLKKLAPIVVIFYLLVLYIHTMHTGYWFFGWKVNRHINNEFAIFQTHTTQQTLSEYSARSYQIQFLSNYKHIDNTPYLDNRVKISLLKTEADNNPTYTYNLSCMGILWDEDINQITNHFGNSFQRDLYEACVKLQHQQLGQPITIAGPPNPVILNEDN
jgi:hypothetical protein